MLLQTVDGVLYLLPALPDKWDSGEVNGLVAENALTFNFKWQDHKIVSVEVISKFDFELKIADFRDNNNKILNYKLEANKTYIL